MAGSDIGPVLSDKIYCDSNTSENEGDNGEGNTHCAERNILQLSQMRSCEWATWSIGSHHDSRTGILVICFAEVEAWR